MEIFLILGVIADLTFVFQRKFEYDEFQNGWFHCSKKGFDSIKDMVLEDG